MFRSLHTSSSVVHIKSTVNIQIINGLLQCYSIVKNTFKNFYLTIFMTIKTNIMNKTIKNFNIHLKIPLISKNPTYLKTPEMEYDSKRNVAKGNRANKGEVKWAKK